MPHVSITGRSASDAVTYSFVIDGQVTSVSDFEDHDRVSFDNRRVDGQVYDVTDEFEYSGCIQAFVYHGPEPIVEIDGQQVPPDQVVECPVPDSWSRVDIVSSEGQTDYVIEVDEGRVEDVALWEPNVDGVRGGGTVIDGAVFNSADTFWYSGCISAVEIGGDTPAIFRDGVEVSMDGLVECPPPGPGDCPEGFSWDAQRGVCVEDTQPDDPPEDEPPEDGPPEDGPSEPARAGMVVVALGLATAAVKYGMSG